MAKSRKPAKPIMSPDGERYMAFEGLVQWTHGVLLQAERVAKAKESLDRLALQTAAERHATVLLSHVEAHFFVIAAHMLLEFQDWVIALGLGKSDDFRELEPFSKTDINDLRNMREHVVEYFQGKGDVPQRWTIETPEFKADASTAVGDLIGGRLNWREFASATKRLHERLLTMSTPRANRQLIP
jgi:hypothetical protein